MKPSRWPKALIGSQDYVILFKARNPNFEIRNKSKIQMFEIQNKSIIIRCFLVLLVLVISISVIRICFDFRASCFTISDFQGCVRFFKTLTHP
jgi:hypothetical protein